MILQSLVRLAEREGLLDDPDYEVKPVHYCVEVDVQGRLVALHDYRDHTSKGKPRGRPLPVPRPVDGARRSGTKIDSGFLVENPSFVFGRDYSKEQRAGKRPGELDRRRTEFRTLVAEAATALGSRSLQCVADFLADDDQRCAALDRLVSMPKFESNQLVCFASSADAGRPAHLDPAIRAWWASRRRPIVAAGPDESTRCVVTGNVGPATDKHPMVKLPGGNPAGVSLVSYNENAYESHGWHRNANAPVSRRAAEAYTTALTRLLSPAFPDPHGTAGSSLPQQYVRLSGDTVAVFWTDNDSVAPSIFGLCLESADPDAVRALYDSVWKGLAVDWEDDSGFYFLLLSAAQARGTIRSFHRATLRKTAEAVRAYFGDVQLGTDGPPVPLRSLLRSTATRGKDDAIRPGLAAELFAAVLTGRPCPIDVLHACLRRARAEQSGDFGPMPVARAALVKACLNRARRRCIAEGNPSPYPEVKPVMDPDNRNHGYLLGRLFACLERMQGLALGDDVNATVVDRYFGSACSSPQSVFPRLLKAEIHHFSKACDGRYAGSARFVHGLVGELCSHLLGVENGIADGEPLERFLRRSGGRISGLPGWLPLDEQGLFALGYHQQRAEFFRKRKPEEALKSDSAAALP